MHEVERLTNGSALCCRKADRGEADAATSTASPVESAARCASCRWRRSTTSPPAARTRSCTSAGATFAVRERMQTLEEQLDPAVFMRVHRSVIVRLDRIDTMLRSPGGDYAVRLKDGTELSVSRGRREALEQRLGVS